MSRKVRKPYPGRDIFHEVFSAGEPGPCLWAFSRADQKNASKGVNLPAHHGGMGGERSEIARPGGTLGRVDEQSARPPFEGPLCLTSQAICRKIRHI